MDLDKVINLVKKMTDKVTKQITIKNVTDRMLLRRLEMFVESGHITVEELNKRLLEN